MTAKLDRLIVTLIGAFFAFGTVDVWAAKAPLSRDELREAASHIIHGKVVGMSSKVQTSKVERAFGMHRDRVFTIELKVDAVLKGSGLKAGDEIEVEAWQPSSRIPLLPGLQGHETIPDKGDTVVVYTKGKKGEAYEPILPNGIVILVGPDAPLATAKGGVHNKSLQPPKDVPPVIGTAVAIPSSAEGDDDKWSVKLVVPKLAWEVIGEERPKLEWPRFNVTVEEATLTLHTRPSHQTDS